jgi:hypothetical protein
MPHGSSLSKPRRVPGLCNPLVPNSITCAAGVIIVRCLAPILKFGGAWLACFLVMARGNVLAAFSFEHVFLVSVCGIVSAAVAVALLAQMDRTIDSAARQATISAIATFLGDVFAHPSHFPPQWAEPTVTAVVSGGIAIAMWHAKRWAKSL